MLLISYSWIHLNATNQPLDKRLWMELLYSLIVDVYWINEESSGNESDAAPHIRIPIYSENILFGI